MTLTNKTLMEILPEVVGIARLAGRAILDVYSSDDAQVEYKGDASPLTAADRAANAVICDRLLALPHQLPLISEENKEIPYEVRKDYASYWLIDPLDGTKEFLRRNGEFTVNIALIQGNRPVLGVVYAPVLDEMYAAVAGEGAWQIIGNEDYRRIHAADFDLNDVGLSIVCSRSHLNAETQVYLDQFDSPQTVSRGSSLKFLLLAKGEAHIYPRLAPTMEWDVAAAQIILEEAGGEVIDFDTREPLRYNKENLLNPFFLALGAVSGR